MLRFTVCAVATLWLLATPSAQEGFSLFTTDFPPDEFAARRAAVYDKIGSTAIAVLRGEPSPPGYTRFRQSNEFYYLTGIEVPHAYVLLDGSTRRAALYLPPRNPRRESAEGKLLSADDADDVRRLSGIEAVYPVESLPEHLAGVAAKGSRSLFTPFTPAESTAMSRDLAQRAITDRATDPFDGTASRETQLIQTLRTRYPGLEIRDLAPTLDAMRLFKSPRERALITKATRLSGLALMEAMRSTEPGIFEFELDAMAKYIFFRHGAQGDAYYSLIASASNAFYPHYNAGKRQMQDGDFLLMDYAPDVGYYMSDVTRMMPVNGTFNAWQRELYTFYLGCYQAVLDAIRPKVTGQAVIREALPIMERLLSATTFSKPAYQAAAGQFVDNYRRQAANPTARLGHWVGMATHDVGSSDGMLLPGMVFTIEPALVVPEEKIYVRLEDLIIVTETGTEVPSSFVPTTIDAIERLMKEPGILQKYPRVGPD